MVESSIYEPAGPISEALASYYVRHIVQRAIDRAFMLSAPASGAPLPATPRSATGRSAPV